MNPKSLHLEDVSISLQGRALLSVTQHVAPGAVLTVMGPSGSGKSTLLAYIGGFLDPAFTGRGRVLVGGDDITVLPQQERHAGILFQDALLFPHMSVAANLAFAIDPALKGRLERRRHAEAMLERMELGGLGARDPDTLSGGQKARVALARVLLSAPRLLLLDEPFSKLDADLRFQMRELVFATARENALPTVLVTHDAADAEAAGGVVVDIGR